MQASVDKVSACYRAKPVPCRPDVVSDIKPTYRASPKLAWCPLRCRPTSSMCGFPTYLPDVGPVSFPTWASQTSARCRPDNYRFRNLADIEPLCFSDIGPTLNLCRPDVSLISFPTFGRHRAHVQTWSRPTIADIGRHLPICRYRPDIMSDIGPISGRYCPISGRHQADRFVISGISMYIIIVIKQV